MSKSGVDIEGLVVSGLFRITFYGRSGTLFVLVSQFYHVINANRIKFYLSIVSSNSEYFAK